MKYKIADLIVEYTAKYDELKRLSEQFIYNGERETDITLSVTDKQLDNMLSRSAKGTTIGGIENFAISSEFNREAIKYGVMLVHSSALIYDGGAYLFSADSGVGKSTHTKLWLKAFGDKVHIMNDDKRNFLMIVFILRASLSCFDPDQGTFRFRCGLNADALF